MCVQKRAEPVAIEKLQHSHTLAYGIGTEKCTREREKTPQQHDRTMGKCSLCTLKTKASMQKKERKKNKPPDTLSKNVQQRRGFLVERHCLRRCTFEHIFAAFSFVRPTTPLRPLLAIFQERSYRRCTVPSCICRRFGALIRYRKNTHACLPVVSIAHPTKTPSTPNRQAASRHWNANVHRSPGLGLCANCRSSRGMTNRKKSLPLSQLCSLTICGVLKA